MNMSSLQTLLESGDVQRYHTQRTLRMQTVSQHVWRTIVILNHLYPEARAALLTATLYHDAEELWLGDIPAPAKRELKPQVDTVERRYTEDIGIQQIMDGVSQEEHFVLKIADYLECGFYCIEEARLGNRTLSSTFNKILEYLSELLEASQQQLERAIWTKAYDYYLQMKEEWQHAVNR